MKQGIFGSPQVNLHKLSQRENRHLLFLLFWPVYWSRYLILEAVNTPERCIPVECALDGKIPFIEYMIIPYLLWHGMVVLMSLYLAFYDVDAFKKYMKFLIISLSASSLIFVLVPTCQNLRPEQFPRENFCTRMVQLLYSMDTNTNTCPSEHVIGAAAFFLGAVSCKRLRKPGILVCVTVLSVLTAVATVFLKQHSILDVAAALPLCLAAWLIVYVRKPENKQAGM